MLCLLHLLKKKQFCLGMNPGSTWSFPFVDEEEKQSAKASGCVLGGLLDFLAAGTTFFLAVEQHFFFVARGRRDLLPHTHETGKERIRSSADSKESSYV